MFDCYSFYGLEVLDIPSDDSFMPDFGDSCDHCIFWIDSETCSDSFSVDVASSRC